MNWRQNILFGLGIAVILIVSTVAFGGSHDAPVYAIVDTEATGAHLYKKQCFTLKSPSPNSPVWLLTFKERLPHRDPNMGCDDTKETWLRKVYILKEVDVGDAPLLQGVKVLAPINLNNHAFVGGVLHPFRVYVKDDPENGENWEVWIDMPDEEPHQNHPNNTEHGGAAHGVR